MHEAEEQDTCRICSAPAEPDQPLFHPCKCSGTIRYIHQDCLTTWLAHSKKKHCDVCKYPYSFTKVYAPNMPSRLPLLLLIQRLIQSAFFAALYGMRAIAVAIIWLALLPLVTVWTWRMYFSMGDSTALWISDREGPAVPGSSPVYTPSFIETPPLTAIWRFLPNFLSHPVWRTISSDIFSGQIIASLIVLTFVAVFLLREWISQNARPGFFDDDVLPEERPPAQEAPLEAPPPPPPAMQAVHRDIRANRGGHDLDRALNPRLANPRQRRRLDARARARATRHGDSDSEGERAAEEKARERFRKHSFTRRLHTARAQGAKRKWEKSPQGPPPPDPAKALSPDTFSFTFKADLPSRSTIAFDQSHPSSPTQGASPQGQNGSIFPSVTLEPPRDAIPFQLDYLPQPPNGNNSPWPRRPPLPGSSLSGPASSPDIQFSPARTPLESPSLSTYRAPEELEAGPSQLGYFQGGSLNGDSQPLVPTSIADEDETNVPNQAEGSGQGGGEGHPRAGTSGSSDSGQDCDDEYTAFFRELSSPSESDRGIIGDDEGNSDDENAEEGDEDEEQPPLANQDNQNLIQIPPFVGPLAPVEERVNRVAAQVEAADAAAIAEAQEDLDANAEDDMDGAMEAIGMRGPIYGVLQNATLMVFVLDTAMGVGIWIPYTIGKSTALLTLDPPRLLKILHFPIRLIRILTDPIVDTFVYLITRFLLPPVLRLCIYIFKALAFLVFSLVGKLIGEQAADSMHELSESAYQTAIDMTNRLHAFLTNSSTRSESHQQVYVPSSLETVVQPVIDLAEPYFAALGANVRQLVMAVQTTWINLALGNGTIERIFALVLGYSAACAMLCVYLNILSVGNMKTAGRAVKKVIRQQLLVLKVAMFIFIELVTFPLGCGLVLDACTVWLFPEASITSRLEFFVYAPLTAMFYHWIAGTMFMYSFAILLSGCRSILRPGAMWFIRDPQDQNAHPIRDILDRPTLTQFRKILVSGLMYTVVVLATVSSIATLLLFGKFSVLPLHWKNRAPLSDVPVDLLFLHLVIPSTLQHFRPKHTIKTLAIHVWKLLAKRLRLTSYFFGEKRLVERYTPKTWRDVFSLEEPTFGEDDVQDGSFRRVPATDNLALPRDMRATALVTEEGNPVDEQAKRLIDMQDAEATKAKRTAENDYKVVYIPPNFAWRIVIFITVLWVIGSIALSILLASPIILGRSLFAMFYRDTVHDGYAFIVGFYLLLGCYFVGFTLDDLDKRRQRKSPTSGTRADIRILALKRGIVWSVKALHLIFCFGILVPMLLGIVMELYIAIPIRQRVDPTFVPRIRVVEAWALGLLYGKIIVQTVRLRPADHPIVVGMNRLVNNGWNNLEPWHATKELIGPLLAGLLIMIISPAIGYQFISRSLRWTGIVNNFSFLHLYPGIFLSVATCKVSSVIYVMLRRWSQKVRDKEFLVEMRLRNHDPNDRVEVVSEGDSD